MKVFRSKFFRLFLLILIIIGLALLLTNKFWVPKIVTYIIQSEGLEGQIIKANFSCAGDKSIRATFHNYQGGTSTVDLVLSDGRSLTLAQAISASGARYASTDESFVFWNKGDTAFVVEQDQDTYVDCLIKK